MHYTRLLKHGDPAINLKQIARARTDATICAVDGCDRFVKQNGWCAKHYQRWRAHGDPLKTKTAPTGALPEFLFAHVNFTGNECVLWPFASKNEHGYGIIWHQGRRRKAHQVMCEIVNGPRPSPKHGALHSCGRGHLGCINPRHLRWGTQKENMKDADDHGTVARSRDLPHTRLTPDDVRFIRKMHGKVTGMELAEKFGVSRKQVYDIQNGRRWTHLKD
jgi:hypothetical protein